MLERERQRSINQKVIKQSDSTRKIARENKQDETKEGKEDNFIY